MPRMARSYLLAATLILLPSVVRAQAESEDASDSVGAAVMSIASVFADIDWQAQAQFQADGSMRLVDDVQLGSEDEGWQLFAEDGIPPAGGFADHGQREHRLRDGRGAHRGRAGRVRHDRSLGGLPRRVRVGEHERRVRAEHVRSPGARDVLHGEQIERTGARSYRLTRGAFTSCVQPTPRWEVVSSSININLDEHLLLRNAVIEVKGVPVLYLPWMYYPIQEDGRAPAS